MPSASILIKPVSSNCNMNCKYCFYKCLSSNREEYSMGFMSMETLEKLVKNAIEYADDYLTFAFQGGEPTLAGIDFFKAAVAFQKKYETIKPGLRIENTLQTNGLLIDDEWGSFLSENNFLVGLSFDGPKKLHDGARVDSMGKGTFDRLMNAVNVLKRHKVAFNIVTVVTEETATKASALYSFYKRNGFEYLQLIPCMDEENRHSRGIKKNPYAVTPIAYGKFLIEFFDLWYEDFKAGNIIDVRMFSNLAQMSIGYPPEECGMCGQCKCYFVVEGNGSVYPCDFYCMDRYRLGNIEESFSELIKKKMAEDFENESIQKPEECRNCDYFSFCRGGCKRFRQYENDIIGVNYLCEGYKLFFEHSSEKLNRLGKTILDPKARAFL